MARVGSMEGGGRQIPPLSWPAGGSSWSSTSAQNVPKIDIECEFFCLSLFDRVLDRCWNPEPIQISWLASKAWDDVGGRGRYGTTEKLFSVNPKNVRNGRNNMIWMSIHRHHPRDPPTHPLVVTSFPRGIWSLMGFAPLPCCDWFMLLSVPFLCWFVTACVSACSSGSFGVVDLHSGKGAMGNWGNDQRMCAFVCPYARTCVWLFIYLCVCLCPCALPRQFER